MNTVLAEAVSVTGLVLVLAFAALRPRGWPEAVAAVPVAVALVGLGAVSPGRALDEAARLAPVAGFLAAVLVLAQMCEDEGLFRAAGAAMAGTCSGRPRRLLAQVFMLAASTTAILSLDATVVLLTPVVFATASTVGTRAKPHVYACAHLANSGSLLLPVSNLTNLLAFTAAGVSFIQFTGLMTAPWVAAVAIEYVVFRRFFAADLGARTEPPPVSPVRPQRMPVFVIVVLALTLAGFATTSLVGISPAWAALAGAVTLAARGLTTQRTSVAKLVRAANLPFVAFVLALGVIVRAVVNNGLDTAVRQLIPTGHGLPALLALAAVAAVLANVVNNLPAVLVLLPLVAPSGTAAVLAVLIGVNIGANLTYTGSLATLLWRRVMHRHNATTDLGEFTRLGLLTVPVTLVVAVLALWGSVHVLLD